MKPNSLSDNKNTGQSTIHSDDNYSNIVIMVNPDPFVEEKTNGETKYSWEISFKEAFGDDIKLEEISILLSHENYVVSLIAKDKTDIIAHAIFVKDPDPYVHDPSAIAHFKLFEDIEILIGSINTIQGQKFDDWWSPRKYKNRQEIQK
jgi:hypothetical protein